MTDPTIRPATAHDVPAIRECVNRAYAVYIPQLGYEPKPMGSDYEALVAQGHVHVLTVADVLVGVLVLYPEDGTLYIDNIAVTPAMQGRGYGRALLDRACVLGREQAFLQLTLYTNVIMTDNIRLYTRYGFRETKRTPGKYPGTTLVHMAYDLTQN